MHQHAVAHIRTRSRGWVDPSVFLLPFLTLAFIFAGPARAETMAQKARAYSLRNGFGEPRQIPLDYAGREGQSRTVVLVTPQSGADFTRTFTEGGGLIWNHMNSGVENGQAEHVQVEIAGEYLHYHPMFNQNGGVSISQAGVLGFQPGQTKIAIGLSQAETSFFRQRSLTTRNSRGNCMGWLIEAQAAPSVRLVNKAGVYHSKSLVQLGKKLIHAGNDNLIIGIPSTGAAAAVANNANPAAIKNQIAGLRAQIAHWGGVGNPQNRIAQIDQELLGLNNWIGQHGAHPAWQPQARQHRNRIGVLNQERAGLLAGQQAPNPANIRQWQGMIRNLEAQLAAFQNPPQPGQELAQFQALQPKDVLGVKPNDRTGAVMR